MNDPGKIHLIDPGFQSQHSGKCDLLVKISPSRLSYAVIDQGQDLIKVLFDNAVGSLEEVSNLLQAETLFNTHFHKIKISWETFRFTFIPAEMYHESHLADYAQFIQAAISDLAVTDIRGPQVKNIFDASAPIKSILDSRFPDCKLTSQANPFIESALKLYGNSGKQLFLNFNQHSFEALLLQDKKLIFYNIFETETPDDFNYFLLLVIRQFELNPKEITPVAAGDIEISSENYHRMKKYFPAVRFADIGLFINKSDISELISPQRFFALAGLNLCE